MEYASGGELYDYLNERKRVSEVEARGIFRQIVSAVHFLHKNRIVHRDLKLENILIDSNGDIKVGPSSTSTLLNLLFNLIILLILNKKSSLILVLVIIGHPIVSCIRFVARRYMPRPKSSMVFLISDLKSTAGLLVSYFTRLSMVLCRSKVGITIV